MKTFLNKDYYYYYIKRYYYYINIGSTQIENRDVCDVILSVYPYRTSLKNMSGHGGNMLL